MALRMRRPGRNGTIAGAGALAALVAVVVLVVAVGPCTDDEDPATPPPPTDPTTTTLSPEQQVAEAYDAYWEMLTRLSAAPDPNDPEIEQRATGEALTEVVEGLGRQRELGQVAEPGPEYRHSIVSIEVSGLRATVRDCTVDDSQILNKATGEVVSGGEPATGLLEASLVRGSNEWRVENVETIETWAGVRPCED